MEMEIVFFMSNSDPAFKSIRATSGDFPMFPPVVNFGDNCNLSFLFLSDRRVPSVVFCCCSRSECFQGCKDAVLHTYLGKSSRSAVSEIIIFLNHLSSQFRCLVSLVRFFWFTVYFLCILCFLVCSCVISCFIWLFVVFLCSIYLLSLSFSTTTMPWLLPAVIVLPCYTWWLFVSPFVSCSFLVSLMIFTISISVKTHLLLVISSSFCVLCFSLLFRRKHNLSRIKIIIIYYCCSLSISISSGI